MFLAFGDTLNKKTESQQVSSTAVVCFVLSATKHRVLVDFHLAVFSLLTRTLLTPSVTGKSLRAVTTKSLNIETFRMNCKSTNGPYV